VRVEKARDKAGGKVRDTADAPGSGDGPVAFQRVALREFGIRDMEAKIPMIDGRSPGILRVSQTLTVIFELPRMGVRSKGDETTVVYGFAYLPGDEGDILKAVSSVNENFTGLQAIRPSVPGLLRGRIQVGVGFGYDHPENLKLAEIAYTCKDKELFDERGADIVRAMEFIGNRLRDAFEPRESRIGGMDLKSARILRTVDMLLRKHGADEAEAGTPGPGKRPDPKSRGERKSNA